MKNMDRDCWARVFGCLHWLLSRMQYILYCYGCQYMCQDWERQSKSVRCERVCWDSPKVNTTVVCAYVTVTWCKLCWSIVRGWTTLNTQLNQGTCSGNLYHRTYRMILGSGDHCLFVTGSVPHRLMWLESLHPWCTLIVFCALWNAHTENFLSQTQIRKRNIWYMCVVHLSL